MRHRRHTISLLREAIFLLLKESEEKEDLGFYQTEFGGMLTGMAYKISDVKSAVESVKDEPDRIEEEFTQSMQFAIQGMIRIAQPSYDCNNAWEVKNSAGPGQGKLVYAMGYYMSPSGKLIADRSSVSKKAQNSWKKVRQKTKGEELDDYIEKNTPPESDDCEVWPVTGKDLNHPKLKDGVKDEETADALNRSYEMGTMGYDFDAMKKKSDSFLKSLPLKRDKINDIIDDCIAAYFSYHYDQ